jgi:hypothetical protein
MVKVQRRAGRLERLSATLISDHVAKHSARANEGSKTVRLPDNGAGAIHEPPQGYTCSQQAAGYEAGGSHVSCPHMEVDTADWS